MTNTEISSEIIPIKSKLVISAVNDALNSMPDYGFVALKIILHQGEIIRVETTKSISEKV